ncbi:hypothetical protein [Streptomyces sp. NBC_00328]|uniref:hypothetical protein n=1 Tax=Streptomyces sp. NBC_00328 TaxID=2903646 RepID=UPI002E2DA377|nr:hypothetical protein [Streptomyces sp. NBC_00328]
MIAQWVDAGGARKGWHWTTDEITDGIAAGPEDIAGLGPNPVTAYLLGHDVGTGKRPARDQAVVLAVTEPPAQPREPKRRWWRRRSRSALSSKDGRPRVTWPNAPRGKRP